METIPEDTCIEVRYVHDKDYRIVAATDVAGGPTPRGDLMMHFFVEHAGFPERSTPHVVTDGRLRPSPDADSDRLLDRSFQFGVLLSPDAAERIANWMLEHAHDIRMREESGPVSEEGEDHA